MNPDPTLFEVPAGIKQSRDCGIKAAGPKLHRHVQVLMRLMASRQLERAAAACSANANANATGRRADLRLAVGAMARTTSYVPRALARLRSFAFGNPGADESRAWLRTSQFTLAQSPSKATLVLLINALAFAAHRMRGRRRRRPQAVEHGCQLRRRRRRAQTGRARLRSSNRHSRQIAEFPYANFSQKSLLI